MSISTLESSASVRAYDAQWADTEQREQMERYFAERFMHLIRHAEVWHPTEMSEERLRFTPGCVERVLRREILVEYLATRLQDGLEKYGEPTIEDAICLLVKAARGVDIREDAKILFGYMANCYGKERAEGAL